IQRPIPGYHVRRACRHHGGDLLLHELSPLGKSLHWRIHREATERPQSQAEGVFLLLTFLVF
uniref:Uncharacterized protein n=2 Tax=Ixodes scapularis TaxID=6945 RepID=A0A1S4L1G1_IXOSC